MNEGSEYRLITCVIHFFLYLVIVLVPWLFVFEMLPFNYAAMTVPVEVGIYVLWCIVLILSVILTKKDIKRYTTGETVSKRMWKVIFMIFRLLMLFTLAYLLLSLFLIGISYMV